MILYRKLDVVKIIVCSSLFLVSWAFETSVTFASDTQDDQQKKSSPTVRELFTDNQIPTLVNLTSRKISDCLVEGSTYVGSYVYRPKGFVPQDITNKTLEQRRARIVQGDLYLKLNICLNSCFGLKDEKTFHYLKSAWEGKTFNLDRNFLLLLLETSIHNSRVQYDIYFHSVFNFLKQMPFQKAKINPFCKNTLDLILQKEDWCLTLFSPVPLKDLDTVQSRLSKMPDNHALDMTLDEVAKIKSEPENPTVTLLKNNNKYKPLESSFSLHIIKTFLVSKKLQTLRERKHHNLRKIDVQLLHNNVHSLAANEESFPLLKDLTTFQMKDLEKVPKLEESYVKEFINICIQSFMNNTSLKILDLTNKNLDSESFQIIGECLKTNTSLQVLKAGNQENYTSNKNNAGLIGMNALSEALKSNKHLVSLSLSRMEISLEECKALCAALSHNSALKSLRLKGCFGRQTESIAEIAKTISSHNNPSFTYLDLRDNESDIESYQMLVDLTADNTNLKIMLPREKKNDQEICALQ